MLANLGMKRYYWSFIVNELKESIRDKVTVHVSKSETIFIFSNEKNFMSLPEKIIKRVRFVTIADGSKDNFKCYPYFTFSFVVMWYIYI